MRAGGGKHKGKQYELSIARMLSSWWFPEKDWSTVHAVDLPFRRTPLSGGWSKSRAPVDVFTDDPSYPFWNECKHREGWSFDQTMRNVETFKPLQWYRSEEEKMCKECEKHPETTKKHLLVFFSRNQMGDYVLMSFTTWTLIAGRGVVQDIPLLIFSDAGHPMVVICVEQLFSHKKEEILNNMNGVDDVRGLTVATELDAPSTETQTTVGK